MACGSCGGGRRPVTTPDGQSVYPPSPDAGTQWEVTYPNGAVLTFDHEWQASTAVAMSGGTVRVLRPGGQNVGDHPTG